MSTPYDLTNPEHVVILITACLARRLGHYVPRGSVDYRQLCEQAASTIEATPDMAEAIAAKLREWRDTP